MYYGVVVLSFIDWIVNMMLVLIVVVYLVWCGWCVVGVLYDGCTVFALFCGCMTCGFNEL